MNPFCGPHGPLLVAEIGGNHEGDFDAALDLAELAIAAGADAVKFQIYFGDTLVSPIESPERHAHFRRFELSPAQHLALAERVLAAGRGYIASVWDLEAFSWIDPVATAYKIGSGDLTAPPFLRSAARTDKPLILSTGLSHLAEVEYAVDYLRATNPRYKDRRQLAVLQCTSMYPISPSDANLSVMQSLAALDVCVGYSDHTIGWRALEIAAAMGAEVLEFHFTDRKEGRSFRDHQLSLDAEDLGSLIRALDDVAALKGDPVKRPLRIEVENNHPESFRRAVYPRRVIEQGEVLTEENLCVLRPNHGIDARDFHRLLGHRARRRLPQFKKFDWRDVE